MEWLEWAQTSASSLVLAQSHQSPTQFGLVTTPDRLTVFFASMPTPRNLASATGPEEAPRSGERSSRPRPGRLLMG